jgi:natural product precursor
MKTSKFTKKIALNKVTIANLKGKEMKNVIGKGTNCTCKHPCPVCSEVFSSC